MDRMQRYWTKVRRGRANECWEWTASRNPCGYGTFRGPVREHDGVQEQLAHRYAWILAHGEIPPDMQVLHRCDNPPCQNPKHLFLGNPRINSADKVAKGRHRWGIRKKGEGSPNAKLTHRQVERIRTIYARGGTSQQALAERFGISQTQVGRIVRGARWPHIDTVPYDFKRSDQARNKPPSS